MADFAVLLTNAMFRRGRRVAREKKMRVSAIMVAIVGLLTASPALAQAWFLYESEEDNFTVNFPSDPVIDATTYRLPSGQEASARVYTVKDDAGTYKVTVVDYEGISAEETASSIEDAANKFRERGGEVTLDEFGYFEGADSQIMQISNPDGTRSYVVIAHLPPASGLIKLYILEGISPPGSVVAGVFQQSLGWVDSYGTRIRYQRDVEGNRYCVIPDAGGAPLRNRLP
jgi:hypothetical protein